MNGHLFFSSFVLYPFSILTCPLNFFCLGWGRDVKLQISVCYGACIALTWQQFDVQYLKEEEETFEPLLNAIVTQANTHVIVLLDVFIGEEKGIFYLFWVGMFERGTNDVWLWLVEDVVDQCSWHFHMLLGWHFDLNMRKHQISEAIFFSPKCECVVVFLLCVCCVALLSSMAIHLEILTPSPPPPPPSPFSHLRRDIVFLQSLSCKFILMDTEWAEVCDGLTCPFA